VAPAAAQVTGKAEKMEQAEKNAKQQEDPIIQLQKRDMDIKEGKEKAKKDTDDQRIALEMQKTDDKKEGDDKRHELEKTKLAVKVAGDIKKHKDDDFKTGLALADRIIDAATRPTNE